MVCKSKETGVSAHIKNQKIEINIYLRKIYKFKLIITLISYSILAFVALREFLFQPGTIGHNWDWSIPPLPIQLRYLADKSFYVWSETSFGGPAAAQIHFRFLSLFLGSFGYIGLAGDFVSKFLVFLIIVLSGTSMFYLVHDILEKQIGESRFNFNIFFSSLLAGYFYALSPFIFAEFIGGAYTQFFAYSIIPAVLYFFRKMAFSGVKLRHVFLLAIFLSLLSTSSQSFVLTVIVLFLYTTIQSKRIKIIKGLLLSFLLYIPINSYWIIPTLHEFATGTSTVVISPQLVSLPALLYGVPSMMEIFVGVGYFRPFFIWVLEKTILPMWATISFSFLACILAFVLFYHKTKEALFWVTLYTLSLAIVTVGKSPISGLILWMYMNIPFMVLFKSPQHLLILTIVPLSIILGIGAFASHSFIQKKTAHFPSTIRRKTLTASLIVLMFISVSIWISPFFTGNLGADYLRDKGGGNYVDTFELSPYFVVVLEKIYTESEKDVFRTLFLPPAGSPYYMETDYQKEGQGGDVVIGSTPRGVSDAYTGYNEPIVTVIRDSFLEGTFKDPPANASKLLRLANVKYIILRNDVKPHFGPNAHLWNFTRTLTKLNEIEDLKLVYEGQHISLWEYKNYLPPIYAAPSSFFIQGDVNRYLAPLTYTKYLDHNPAIIFADQSTSKQMANLNKINAIILNESQIWSDVPAYARPNLLKNPSFEEKFGSKMVAILDQAQPLIGSGNFPLKADSSSYLLAQTFVPETTSISRVDVFVAKIGSPDGDLKVMLQPTSEQLPTGKVLASTIIPKTSIDTNWTWITVNLPYDHLIPGKMYAIVLDKTTPTLDWNNVYTWEFREDLDYYPNGIAYLYNGANWVKRSNTTDFAFRTYFSKPMPEGWNHQSIGEDKSDWEWTTAISYHDDSSLKIEKLNDVGHSMIYSDPITVAGDSLYTLSLFIGTDRIRADAIQYQVGWLTSEGEWISAAEGWTDGSISWQRYSLTAMSPTNAGQAYVRLIIPEEVTVYFDAVQLEREDKATNFWMPPEKLEHETFKRLTENSTSIVSFQKINPTKYVIYVDTKEPFWLVFSESYHPQWKAYINEKGETNWIEAFYQRPISDDKHFLTNGYANAWYVNKTGTYTITLEFWPQKLFYIGSAVSITTLTICILYISQNKIKTTYHLHIKKKNKQCY